MIDDGIGGSIVNVTSMIAFTTMGKLATYGMSKAAGEHLTRSLASEWARYGIRVNSLAPGYIETEINSAFFASEAGQAFVRTLPRRRIGTPSDLDGPLLLLASDASHFMTGSSINVDDGQILGK